MNIFRGTAYPFPLTIRMMENHPLGSQFFMPLDPFDYLVAVAEAKPTVMPEDVLFFSCSHKQGVNFKRGVWDHPLLVLAEKQDFLVIDRAGEGVKLVEHDLALPIMVDLDENNPQGKLEPRPRQKSSNHSSRLIFTSKDLAHLLIRSGFLLPRIGRILAG